MKKPPLEVEIKFYLSDMSSFEKRLISIGATLVRPRTHEFNYRFDTPDMKFSNEHKVLRLRQDNASILTYKGPAQPSDSVSIRREIEFEVSDFDSAFDLLKELGFQVSVQYEKWRAIYQMNDLEITIDELPYGNFTEIEGGGPEEIRKMASILALDWNNRLSCSYVLLFDRLQKKKDIKLNNLTFDELRSISVTPADLGVKPADTPFFL